MLNIFLISMLHSGQLSARPADEQLSAISRLGELNGVALHCRYIEQMQSIKRLLLLNLPRQRELGLWFEQKTNAAFMSFINNEDSCPDLEAFTQQVKEAGTQLETAFKK